MAAYTASWKSILNAMTARRMQSILLDPGPVKCEEFLEIAKRDGYETKNVPTIMPVTFTFGEGGKKSLGSLPIWTFRTPGSGWKTDPYKTRNYRWQALCAWFV